MLRIMTILTLLTLTSAASFACQDCAQHTQDLIETSSNEEQCLQAVQDAWEEDRITQWEHDQMNDQCMDQAY